MASNFVTYDVIFSDKILKNSNFLLKRINSDIVCNRGASVRLKIVAAKNIQRKLTEGNKWEESFPDPAQQREISPRLILYTMKN